LLDLDKFEQVLRRFGNRAEAVGNFGSKTFDFQPAAQIVQPALKSPAYRHDARRTIGD